MTPPARSGPTLRTRIAAWLAGATLVLTVAALGAAFLAVREALRDDLQAALRRDALAVAAAYDGEAGEAGASIRPGPTGRVVVQVYGRDGALIAASDAAFEVPEARLPAEVVAAAPSDWRGRRVGRTLQAAAAPFRAGTIVVLADADYVGAALGAVARSLLWVGVALVLVALPVAWLAARSTTAPLRRLARAADRVDDARLEPLRLPMPDDDVGRLAEVLDRLLERLRDARDAQRRFLAETSHELRTPLTSLRGFLARARRNAATQPGGPDHDRDLADAERIAGGMARLVEDLLELSRGRIAREIDPHLVAIGPEVVEPVAAEVDAVVVAPGADAGDAGFGDAGSGDAGDADARDADAGDADARDALVLGEPLRLRQVLRNLVTNARRAAGPAGQVTVAWGADAEVVWIRVDDDGPGIPEEALADLFEPFRPGPGGGTGLGLAIARQLAEAHGGRIEVRSRPGATSFTITLPRLDGRPGEEGDPGPNA